MGGLKDATYAAAKLAHLGADYDIDYWNRSSLEQQLLMELRSESLALGQTAGLIPRREIERVLDPVLEQARAIADSTIRAGCTPIAGAARRTFRSERCPVQDHLPRFAGFMISKPSNNRGRRTGA